MPLTVHDMLAFDSLKDSKTIAGIDGLNNEVTGIMVMEGPDIDVWGNAGQVILTSFFALKDFTEKEINDFFLKADEVGISAIIVKVDRLVQLIPENFKEQCNRFSIPLVKITKETKYEAIILTVMETLINKNKVLLDYYYDINKELTRMALNEPKLQDIISYLKKLIGKDVSLYKNREYVEVSTKKTLDHFNVIQKAVLPKKRYTTFSYKEQVVFYPDINKQTENKQLVVDIPSLTPDTYQLVIHFLNKEITERDFMAIENTVGFLQMELIKKYAITQQNLNHIYELINDLIFGRFHSEEEMYEVLHYLKFHAEDTFNLVIVDIIKDLNIDDMKWNDSALIAKNLTPYIQMFWKKYVYIVKKRKIVFLISNTDDDLSFKDNILSAIQSFIKSGQFENLHYNVGISSKTDARTLPIANKQANGILKLLRNTKKQDKIFSYHDLGIFRIFMETSNIDDLASFIPDSLLTVEEKNPELNQTLRVFLDNNQNYTLTAKILYIHPKTAKYRIDRIKELTGLSLDDPEDVLNMNIGLRLLDFINNQNYTL